MQGKLIIFSAPSGAGKTTIVKHLLSQGLPLEFSISACSRPLRNNEIDGKDYYFISVEEFREKIKKGEFIEWEEVYKDHYYGTLKSELKRIWDNEKHVIFDVDVKGGLNLKKQFHYRALAVFVMPPSLEVLEKRLRSRAADSEEKIRVRLEKAKREMENAEEFDVIIINDNLDEALKKAEKEVRKFINK